MTKLKDDSAAGSSEFVKEESIERARSMKVSDKTVDKFMEATRSGLQTFGGKQLRGLLENLGLRITAHSDRLEMETAPVIGGCSAHERSIRTEAQAPTDRVSSRSKGSNRRRPVPSGRPFPNHTTLEPLENRSGFHSCASLRSFEGPFPEDLHLQEHLWIQIPTALRSAHGMNAMFVSRSLYRIEGISGIEPPLH